MNTDVGHVSLPAFNLLAIAERGRIMRCEQILQRPRVEFLFISRVRLLKIAFTWSTKTRSFVRVLSGEIRSLAKHQKMELFLLVVLLLEDLVMMLVLPLNP